jgi:catechol 2,3-dioxygenase-like lactoylglutathione lyase family enzyme
LFVVRSSFEVFVKLTYVIVYVSDVRSSLEFYEKAFGLKRRLFDDDGGEYAELDTGGTTLALASHEIASKHFPAGYIAVDQSDKPLGVEIALGTDSVSESYEKAISCGATSLKAPAETPWGQTVAYVRCPDGTLIEICSPMET